MKFNKKSSAIVAAVIASVTVGSFTVANASPSKSTKSVAVTKPTIGGARATAGANPLKGVLDALVTKGTITQAQEDAIVAAFQAAKPAPVAGGAAGGPGFGGPRGGMGGGIAGVDQAAEQATILTTLGIDAATLKAGRDAGKSLATIAGTKSQALIDALVALENKEIDAAVTAGKITAAQATNQKANTVARVTAHVNAAPRQPGMGGFGGMGHMGGRGPAPVAPAAPSTNG
jgi:polyhydroxyalkanoate synthesis regulator phasin